MKFLIDAQLPRKLAGLLNGSGHDARHTTDLPLGNRTTDLHIAATADREGRVVVTKDRDFWVNHVLGGSPRSVLVVATGNITNSALLQLVGSHLDEITALLSDCPVVELGRDRLIGHGTGADDDPARQ